MRGRKVLAELQALGIPEDQYPKQFICPGCGKLLEVWTWGRHPTYRYENRAIVRGSVPFHIILTCPTAGHAGRKEREEMKDIYRDHFRCEWERTVRMPARGECLGKPYEPKYVGEWERRRNPRKPAWIIDQ